MFGIQAGCDGVVIREGDGGIGGNHSVGRAGAMRRQLLQVGCAVALGVVVTKTVERNEDYVRLGELLRSVRPVINGDNGRDGLSDGWRDALRRAGGTEAAEQDERAAQTKPGARDPSIHAATLRRKCSSGRVPQGGTELRRLLVSGRAC